MKTKIVATIGPASSSKTILKQLIHAGVDVFRINFSHAEYSNVEKIIKTIRELNLELNTHIPILADLQGPKIRIGNLPGDKIKIRKGDRLTFTTIPGDSNPSRIFINYPDFPKDIKSGDSILLDDGKLTLQIEETNCKDEVVAKVLIGGELNSRKGVNLPDTKLSLPSLSEKDRRDLDFILAHNIEWIALSFVRSAADVQELIDLIKSKKAGNIPPVIAKIEKPEAIENLDEILKIANGAMVARGDLGVEIPLETVPLIQKRIVKKCLALAKPVIIATQMMEGMLENSRPTRAEVNDVANSVLDGADALMLSGETSVGKFPVETVKTMQKIITEVEDFEDIYNKKHKPVKENNPDFISDSIIYSGCNMAREANARAIVSVASSGYSAAKIASYRPNATIYTFADNEYILCRLNLVWGIRPRFYPEFLHTDKTIAVLMDELKAKKFVKSGDLLVHISNMPINQPGRSNMLKLSYVE
jgi:pyruvate kinase